MEAVKLLLEDYQRRLKTINIEIDEMLVKDAGNATYCRYQAKAGCYRTFISELERAIVDDSNE
jgi:hypothetical protein